MEQSLLLWLLLMLASASCGKAPLDLTGVQEMEGTWKASVSLPCVYEPSADFAQEAVAWKTSLLDHGLRTIFRRDPTSGDQTLLTHFRNRIRVPKDPPGDVSLHIEDLEMGDGGQYTCEVVWVARNNSKVVKEKTTFLRVVKVAVTKPVITAGTMGSVLPGGRNTSLACQTHGSPPIIYRWFKEAQGGSAGRVGQSAVLHFDRLQISDTGTYFCEVENRVGSVVQRSSGFQLTVKDPSEFPSLRPSSENADATVAERETVTAKWEVRAGTGARSLSTRRTPTHTHTKDLVPASLDPGRTDQVSEHHAVNPAPQRTGLPLYVIVLIAVLCGAVLLMALAAVVFCRRKPKSDPVYEVTYNNCAPVRREEASCAVAGIYRGGAEQVTPRAENSYTVEPAQILEHGPMDAKLDDEYEMLVHKMESEYEVVGAQ